MQFETPQPTVQGRRRKGADVESSGGGEEVKERTSQPICKILVLFNVCLILLFFVCLSQWPSVLFFCFLFLRLLKQINTYRAPGHTAQMIG